MRRKPSPTVMFVFLCVVYAFALGGAPPSTEGWRAPLDLPFLTGVGGPGDDAGDSGDENVAGASDLANAGPQTDATGNPPVAVASAEPAEVAPPKKDPITEHTVQSGETLSDIAGKYNTDVATIAGVNNLSSINRLSVGQKLKILTVKGALHTVKQGESLWDIAKSYKVDIDKIIAANDLDNPEKLQLKQELVIPGAKPKPTQTATASRPKAVISTSGKLQRAFSWPARGRISSRFGRRWGRMHEGLDIAVPTGTPVRAAAAGRVTFAGWSSGYGYLVKVSHGNGVETRYGHNSRILVRVGQSVDAGQVLARSGNTGNSTGPHVHFEIRMNGVAKNPASYLR